MKVFVCLSTEPYESYQGFCGVFLTAEEAIEAVPKFDSYVDEVFEVEAGDTTGDSWVRVWPEDERTS